MFQQINQRTISICQKHNQEILCVLNQNISAILNPFLCLKCVTEYAISGDQFFLIQDVKNYKLNDIFKNFPPLQKNVQEKVDGAKQRFEQDFQKQMDSFFDFARELQQKLKQFLDGLEKQIDLYFEQIINKKDQFYSQYQELSQIQHLQSIVNLKDEDKKVSQMNLFLQKMNEQKKDNSKKLSEIFDELEMLVEQISGEKQNEIEQKYQQFTNSLDLSMIEKNDLNMKKNSIFYQKQNEKTNLNDSAKQESINLLFYAKQLNQSNILASKQDNLINNNNNYIEIESTTNNNYYDENDIIESIEFCELNDYEILNIIRSKNSIEIINKINQDAKAHCQLDLQKFKYTIQFQYHPVHSGAKLQIGIVQNIQRHNLIEKQFKDATMQKMELVLDRQKNIFTLQNLYERKKQELKIKFNKKIHYLIVQLNDKKESIKFTSFKQQIIE